MAGQDDPVGDSNPITKKQLEQITSFLHKLDDPEPTAQTHTAQHRDVSPSPDQLTSLFRYLDDQYWSAKSNMSMDNIDEATIKRPILLHLCSGNGQAVVAATRFNLCSQAIGLDTNSLNITNSKKLAFQQKVFSKCHFFETESLDNVDPKILLDNPHLIADKMNESNVVYLHATNPDMIEKLVPLLALLSSKRKGRKFITSGYHLSNEFAVSPNLISGTELCVYDGVVDSRVKQEILLPPPPRPVDGDEIDKEFARGSIRHAMPERF